MGGFTFQPHAGVLRGLSFEAQTEEFLNKLQEEISAVALAAADAQSAVAKAVSAAETAGLASVAAQYAAQQAQSFADNAITKAELAWQQAQSALASAHNATTVAEGALKTSLDTQAHVRDVDSHLEQVKQEVDEKSPLASPSLTGTPKAPTAAAGKNDTQIANTAFVQSALSPLATRIAGLEASFSKISIFKG